MNRRNYSCNYDGRRVLIFGAAGYISSSLINLLLENNYIVHGVDNNFKNTADSLLCYITDKNFTFELGDITNLQDVKKAYKFRPDYIFLASALVGYPICLRFEKLASLVNIDGVSNVLYEKPDYVKLIFPSTGSVYKPGQLICDENAIVEPLSHYGFTKIEGEKIVLNHSNTIVHRYGTAMGCSKNNIRVNLLANDMTIQGIINRSITVFESSFVRSFIHVENIANSIVFTMENFNQMLKDKTKIFNVTNNNINVTKKDLCELIKSKTGCNITYAEISKDLDQRNYSMNADKIYSYGYKAEITLEETIDELIKAAPLLSTFEKYK